MRLWLLLAACVAGAGCGDVRKVPGTGYQGWEAFGGGADQIQYSRLDQIHPGNVSQLEVAWTYETGDEFRGSEIQCNPIVIDGLLYGSSPNGRVFALDAATGEEVWTRRLEVDGALFTGRSRNRGFMHWRDGDDSRIYAGARHMLYALDARTGEPVEGFGERGAINLRSDLPERAGSLSISLNTPGVVYDDLLILGSVVSESLPSAPGYIRGYDARTGEWRWTFRTIPHPGEPGHETWPEDGWKTLGGANSWAGLALDAARGLVYAGTGSAAFDFWGVCHEFVPMSLIASKMDITLFSPNSYRRLTYHLVSGSLKLKGGQKGGYNGETWHQTHGGIRTEDQDAGEVPRRSRTNASGNIIRVQAMDPAHRIPRSAPRVRIGWIPDRFAR
ncbi:MAG: PQQ-binding-like beta-propeller repeat protein [Bryobacterales bacterium]|nr:PQQ-binding-like beta-propeller repeat protein [Bryobacterales bacterium]